jgi:penicillin-binding protein 1C
MKRFIWPIVLIILIMTIGYFLIPKPDLVSYQGYSRAFFDKNNQLLRLTLASDQRYRLYVKLDDVAPALKEATLEYEDQGFYHHPGIDPVALFRAVWSTYITGERRIGGSTITMQVARLRWGLNSRSISGKILQILRAVQLTRHYSKDAIFEAYLNLASYGRNIEGIAAASLIYFNKPAAQLTLPEALSLCVIPQNPVKRNPTTHDGRQNLKVARAALFERWLESHPQAAEQKIFFDLQLKIRPPEALPFNAPHFVNMIDRTLPTLQAGAIKTTLDFNLQQSIETHLKNYIDRHKNLGYQNGSVVVLNYTTMELEALVGSVNFWDKTIAGQVNGPNAKRSPGSTLKPFVYALAMDQGLIHPLSMLRDSPHRYAGFTPENFDKQFLGPIFAQDALVLSRNVPAAELQSKLNSPSLYQWLVAAGIKGLKPQGHYGLSLSLGGAELTMLELIQLYAALPNRGLLQPIKTLARPNSEQGFSVLSPEAAYLTLDILSRNPPPNSPELTGQMSHHLQVAWKTGTSFAFRDSWAIGISGPYVIAVWIGNFDGSGNPEFVGRKASGPLLFELFRSLKGSEEWSATGSHNPGLLNLKRVSVCTASGDLPNQYCPDTTETWFIPGVSPIKVSTLHRAVPINPTSGLRACFHQPGKTELHVYEFWPSDLSNIFRQAGISLITPPPYEDDCDINAFRQDGTPPIISSPSWGVKYRLRSDRQGQELILFAAAVEAGVQEVFWFVDDKFVGKAKAGEPFFWQPRSGQFIVRAVDDQGRAAQRTLEVAFVKEFDEKTVND